MNVQLSEVVFCNPKVAELKQSAEDLGRSAYSLVVKVERTILSAGTEISILSGEWGQSVRFPFSPKAMATGRIVHMGTAASQIRRDLHVDDRVLLKGRHSSFVEASVLTDPIVKLDGDTSDEAALLARLARLVERAASLCDQKDARILVLGLGLVGQLLVRACRSKSYKNVTAFDPHPKRRAQAKLDSYCVLETRAYPESDFVFVANSSVDAVQQGLVTLAKNGRLILLGATRGSPPIDLAHTVFRRNIVIQGAHEQFLIAGSDAEDELLRTARLIDDREIETSGLIKNLDSRGLPSLYKDGLSCKDEYIGIVVNWC